MNCDLRHVTVVLCCDPKAFTHYQPARRHVRGRLPGLGVGGRRRAGVGAAAARGRASRSSTRTSASSRCPASRSRARPPTAATCSCACRATRSSARSSPSRRCSRSSASRQEQFREVVHKQYVKKFGRLGDARREVQHGGHDPGLRARPRDPRSASSRRADRSTLRGQALLPVVPPETATATAAARGCRSHADSRGPGGAHAAHADRVVRRASSAPDSATTSPPRRWRRSASWPPAAATRRRSTSPGAKRRSTSRRTARSAWSASRSVRTRRCPTARRISKRCCGRRSPTT